MPNALETWIEDGLQATRLADTVATWVRGLAAVIFVLGAVSIAVIVAGSDGEDEVAIVVASFALSTALSVALLAAVASVLDMLRLQAESALFNEDDEDEAP